MYKSLIVALSLVLGLAGCSPASAHALDPSKDMDCALTTYYFQRVAIHENAPEKPTVALRIFNQWFAAKLHAARIKPTQSDIESVSDAIQENPNAAREQLNACMKRAAGEDHFNQFAKGMGWIG
jgi:hypothetical protein